MSAQAKLKPETTPTTAGGTKSGGTGGSAKAAENARQELIAKVLAAKGTKAQNGTCSKCGRTGLKPDERTVTPRAEIVCLDCADGSTDDPWKKARRAAYEALGHSPDGKCPAGVDWRGDNRRFVPPDLDAAMVARQNAAETHSANPSEATKKALEDAEADFFAACIAAKPLSLDRNREALAPAHRRASYYNHTGEVTPADDPFPSCGWWWCGRELKHDQWIQLQKAIEVLRVEGIDPCGLGVSYVALLYSEGKAWGRGVASLRKIEAMSLAERKMCCVDNSNFERVMEFAKWSAAPRDGGGHAKDITTWRFLWHVEQARSSGTWWPRSPDSRPLQVVSAAILLLFDLQPQENVTLESETARLLEAWKSSKAWGQELKAKQENLNAEA